MTMTIGTTTSYNQNDELVVQWLLETEASLTLSPIQKKLKMAKETIILANLAVDFLPFDDNNSDDARQDAHQKRFEQLQNYYYQATNKTKIDTISMLHLSSRMEIENETERKKLQTQVHSLLEQLATVAAQELYQEIRQEEEHKTRQQQRRITKRRKKKSKRKQKTSEDNKSPNAVILTMPILLNTTTCPESKQQESKQQHTHQQQHQQDAFQDNNTTEDDDNEDASNAGNDNHAPLLTHISHGAEESKDMYDDANSSFLFDSYIEIAEADDDDPDDDFVVIPLGSPTRNKPSNNSKNMSYLQALGVITPEISKVMQTQRKEHLEMMQQVQLKAFIAETQATAARERIATLETLLQQVVLNSSTNLDLKRTIETTLATNSGEY